MRLDADQIAHLVEIGRRKGRVSFTDVREALPYRDFEPEDWKAIVALLESRGVEVEMSHAKIISGQFGGGRDA